MSSMAVAGQFAGTELLVEQSDCRVFLGDRELGSGTIRITESDVSWSSCDNGERLSLDYPRICVHAISRDVTAFPSPCVYLLYSATPPDSSGSDDEGEVPDVDELPPTEVRVVPPDSDQLETIYSAICECQLLYPDPEQSDSSCEDDEEITGAEWSEGDGDNVQHIQQCPADFFTSADGLEHLTAEGEAVLAHLESILHTQAQDSQNGDAENGQFEDADITDN